MNDLSVGESFARLGLGGALSVLAHQTNTSMRRGRINSGRPPDERFFTDGHFNDIGAWVAGSRAIVNLRTYESDTGADAFIMIRYPNGKWWGFAIQAKRLVSHKSADVTALARPPHYADLDYPPESGRKQYDRLLTSCTSGRFFDGCFPIYLFYNELTNEFPRSGWACESVFPGDPGEFGCTVARAEDVKIVADQQHAKRVPGRATFPIDKFTEISRPWLCLLCFEGQGHCAATTRQTRGRLAPKGSVLRPLLPRPDAEPESTRRIAEPWPEMPSPRPLTPEDLSGGVAVLTRLIAEPSSRPNAEERALLAEHTRAVVAVDLAEPTQGREA